MPSFAGLLCWLLGYKPAEADKQLEHLSAVSMRLELKTGINDCSVIDDSYNSDIQSLEIALNFLTQQNQHAKKTVDTVGYIPVWFAG